MQNQRSASPLVAYCVISLWNFCFCFMIIRSTDGCFKLSLVTLAACFTIASTASSCSLNPPLSLRSLACCCAVDIYFFCSLGSNLFSLSGDNRFIVIRSSICSSCTLRVLASTVFFLNVASSLLSKPNRSRRVLIASSICSSVNPSASDALSRKESTNCCSACLKLYLTFSFRLVPVRNSLCSYLFLKANLAPYSSP